MDSIPYCDELIKEYLLFRGYIKTYTAFTTDHQKDLNNKPSIHSINNEIFFRLNQKT